MLRCALLDDYQGAALSRAPFERLDGKLAIDVYRDNIADTAGVIARLAPYEIIVAMRERTPFDAERIAALPKLKLLVTTGMHNRGIDMEAAKRHGVMVCGTPGHPGSTAELTWALLLAAMRHIPAEVANFQAGGAWQTRVGRDLGGLTLGLLGLGTVGSQVARYGVAFGMKVLGWSRSNTPERSAALGISCAPSLDAVLAQSDVVSVHIPSTPATRGLIGAAQLAAMKPDAVLINTSRGALVDTDALIAALRAGRLGGAGIDVYDQEPLPAGHPLRSAPNLVATPHLGYVTENTYRAFFGGVVDALEGWLDGRPVRILNG